MHATSISISIKDGNSSNIFESLDNWITMITATKHLLAFVQVFRGTKVSQQQQALRKSHMH